MCCTLSSAYVFFFKQKTAYEMRISDWSSDVCSSDLGEATLLEDLQQRVEHVGVGLLDLVEQHHREWLAPHGLGELAALLVADVAGGRAHQPGDGVLLHVLRHVEADHGVLVAEQRSEEHTSELQSQMSIS